MKLLKNQRLSYGVCEIGNQLSVIYTAGQKSLSILKKLMLSLLLAKENLLISWNWDVHSASHKFGDCASKIETSGAIFI